MFPNTIENMEQQYPEVADFVREMEKGFRVGNNIVAVDAPVKSGKRIIKELFKLRNDSLFKHWYISALVRKDDANQLQELESYGFEVYIARGRKLNELMTAIDQVTHSNEIVYVHFNESDYGTDEKQNIAPCYARLRNLPNVRIICYSATNEELLCSDDDHLPLRFDPPDSYRGAAFFLDQKLVTEAEPFWDENCNKISEQGEFILRQWDLQNSLVDKTELKIFGVVRFSSHFQKIFPRFKKDMRQRKIEIRAVTGAESFDWSDGFRIYRDRLLHGESNLRVLFVLNQTCSRSTEIKFHEHIAFWHDYRKDSFYNTILQASGRVFHYSKKIFDHEGNERFVSYCPIHTYADVAAFELAAHRISLSDYYDKVSSRVAVGDYTRNKYEYKRKIFDHCPSDIEIIEAHQEHGISAKGKRFNLTNSKNYANDQTATWIGYENNPHSQKTECDSLLFLDSPNPKFISSWNKYVVPENLQGHWVLLIPIIIESQLIQHKTKSSSMYSQLKVVP